MRTINQMIGQAPKYFGEASMHYVVTHFGKQEREKKMLSEFRKKPYFLTIGDKNGEQKMD